MKIIKQSVKRCLYIQLHLSMQLFNIEIVHMKGENSMYAHVFKNYCKHFHNLGIILLASYNFENEIIMS